MIFTDFPNYTFMKKNYTKKNHGKSCFPQVFP